MEVSHLSSAGESTVRLVVQAKLAKGAVEQQGAVALKLIESTGEAAFGRDGHPTGQRLDVSA